MLDVFPAPINIIPLKKRPSNDIINVGDFYHGIVETTSVKYNISWQLYLPAIHEATKI